MGALVGAAVGAVVGAWIVLLVSPTQDFGAVGEAIVGMISGGTIAAVVMGALGAGAVLQRTGAAAARETAFAILVLNLAWLPILNAAMTGFGNYVYGTGEVIFPVVTWVYLATVAPAIACFLTARMRRAPGGS